MTLFANLPAPTVALAGTEQTTSDQGVCYCNGTQWIIIGFPTVTGGSISLTSPSSTIAITGSPGNVITEDVVPALLGGQGLVPGIFTFATLPAATANANMYARTSDTGAVYSNGSVWNPLFNQTNSTVAVANNPPLITGANGVAYSLQLSATGGTPPYSWIKVSQFADTNTWTVSATGVLACASPATATQDNIDVQVTDSTGAVAQKLLTVSIAASAGTPAAAPTFSPVAGTYTGTQTVTITDASAGTTIYVTTNGSTPTTSSPVYSGPITVSASQTINAIAAGGSFTQSPIGSASYIINAITSSLGFPVTGIWSSGGNQNNYGSPAWLSGAAKYNNIFMGWYLGTEQSIQAAFPGMTMPKIMQTLKTNAVSAGNTSCKTFLYQIENEWFQTTGDSGFKDNARLSLLNANAYWWLSSNYPGQTHVTSQDGPPKGAVNITNTTPVYNITTVGGLTGPGNVNAQQALGWLEIQQMINGLASSANPSDPATTANPFLDGLFHDNQEQSPYVSGCHLTTSTSYSGSAGTNNTSLNAPCAAGYGQLVAMQRALQPNLLQVGNCDNFGYGLNAVYSPGSIGLYDYPFAEYPFSRFEHNQGSVFTDLLTTFVNYEQLLRTKSGNYVIGQIEGPAADSSGNPIFWNSAQSTFVASDWQAWRYQAAIFTMMRWIVCPPSPQPTPVYWFDELDGAGALGVNWMGAPVGARNLTKIAGSPGTYGLFQADFANGSVIINPKGNGSQTINMPYAGTYLGYNGFGDPLVNTGAAFTTASTHTFADRDAIFIKRGAGGGGGGGGTTQSILQFIPSDVGTSATSTSQAMATVTAGSTILVLTFTNFQSVSSVTDSQGNAYNLVQTAASTAGPGNQKFYVYAAYNAVGGANTVTIAYGGSTTLRPILLLEVGGTAAAPLDGSNHNDQTSPGTGAGAVVTGAASNTAQPALAIGFTMPLFSNSVPTAVAPYTSEGTFWSATTTGRCEFLALTGTGSQQATFTATAGTTEHLSLLVILNHS